MADVRELAELSEYDKKQRTHGNYHEELRKQNQLEVDIRDCKQQLLQKDKVTAVLREKVNEFR